jgi:rare lipoprotein A
MKKLILIPVTLLLLQACTNLTSGRYQQKHDSTPTRLPTANETRDAVPRKEPLSKGGNKNYTVRGKHYQVLKSADNFSEEGIASWYGKKFHGHLTSNGEVYNMYGMSAAHKNLPLPTYVKVTNQSNQKSVIVRVNDRGPFHQGRVIDLSYSAAYKLDMLKTGTARVKVEAITDFEFKSKKHLFEKNKEYIQVFATKNRITADKTVESLKSTYKTNANWYKTGDVYRIKLGPIQDQTQLQLLVNQLKKNGYPGAFVKKM